jgi:hypothetical protein
MTFRIVAAVTGLVFLVPVLNVLAPWTLVLDTGDSHAQVDRWFITVSGAEDLIQAVVLLALAWRPRRPLLALYLVVAMAVAAVVNLPFVPSFVVILAALVPALATYPYWAELRDAPRWWRRADQPLLLVGAVTAVAALGGAIVSIGRQIGGTDAAAEANWWADYAEHVLLLSVAVLVASCVKPGWRVLTGTAAVSWTYLGLVAAVVLPDATGSWGVTAGLVSLVVGLGLAAVTVFDADHHWVLIPQLRPH